MPLKLRPPTPGKTPNWHVRGTYRGIYVERTAGTPDKKAALRFMRDIRESIERGDHSARGTNAVEAQSAPPVEPTFADAALAYLKADGDPKFLSAIINQTGKHALAPRKLSDIDQLLIDNAATALYPSATPQTRNRQFYTPVSAVLKRAGIERKIKRPKGWRGSKSTSWLEPEQAFAVIAAAYNIDPEFGLLCLTYLYTGRRESDLLDAKLRQLNVDQALIYLPDTKNGEPAPVHLPPVVVKAFLSQPPRTKRPRKLGDAKLGNGIAGRSRADAGIPFLDRHPDAKLFRFHNGGHLRDMLKDAMRAAGVSFPPRQGGFHLFCHTYGTWMKRYGGLDTYGLVRTGRWKDPDSADRYNHTAASAEARLADLLPTPTKTRKAQPGLKLNRARR